MKAQVAGIASARWTPEALKDLNQRFEGRPRQEVLRWGWETFSPHLALATNFGLQSIVLLHLIAQSYPEMTIFYLDTDLLFSETYTLRDELSARLGLRLACVCTGVSLIDQAAKYGPALWSQDPDLCCHLRKVEPLRLFLATQHAWITGIRHDRMERRSNAGLIEWDRAYGLVKLNPLANWPSGPC